LSAATPPDTTPKKSPAGGGAIESASDEKCVVAVLPREIMILSRSHDRMTPVSVLKALTIEAADPVGEVARELIYALCSEMSERYGARPSPFSSSEGAEYRTVFLVAGLRGQPVGCGALRSLDHHTAEIKRIYVVPSARGKGVARHLITELERHAKEFGYRRICLETGVRQPEAQRLYESLGYRHIAAFGLYIGNPTSVCYEKVFPDTVHPMEPITILPYSDADHRAEVIALWDGVFDYEAAHNQPALVIDKKTANADQLFFVALSAGRVVGTVMAGYDGHRGWIYSVAVSPAHRRRGVGSQLVRFTEKALTTKGCVKVNLQIMERNESVVGFYASLGFSVEKRVSMGKRLTENIPDS
jgi:ribosomal protein S18 acetylase RimI-like enzyme